MLLSVFLARSWTKNGAAREAWLKFLPTLPTGDRIIASEEEIQKILPKKSEYLVSTSEFDDIKARLQSVITQHKRQKPGDSGPTLRKRETPDQTTTQSTPPQQTDSGDDSPPVLKRRD